MIKMVREKTFIIRLSSLFDKEYKDCCKTDPLATLIQDRIEENWQDTMILSGQIQLKINGNLPSSV